MNKDLTANVNNQDVPADIRDIAGNFGHRLAFLSGAATQWKPTAFRGSPDTGLESLADNGNGVEAHIRLKISKADRTATMEVELVNTTTFASEPLNAVCLSAILADQGVPYLGSSAAGGAQMGQYPPSGCFRVQHVRLDESLWIGSMAGGRSSDVHLPFTILADRDGSGIWFGMECSGLWSHMCQTQMDGTTHVTLAAGMGTGYGFYLLDPEFRLNAQERIKLPPVHFGFFDGGLPEGENALRRHLRRSICPPLNGKPVLPHLAYDHWFGLGMNFDHITLRRQVDRAAELGLEVFVLDAGWFDGGFPLGVGSWVPDKIKFPDGLAPFADYVRSRGLQFGIFYEPERATRQSEWVRQHPDLFLDDGYPSLTLNLALPAAQDLVIEETDKLIREHDIRWIRWDLNMDMTPYWRSADRTGRLQLAYCKGLYRVLGELLNRHPQCVHENCASGGRRIDIGTLRYAQSAWINDTTVGADLCRFIQLQANVFLPAHLCGSAVAVQEGFADLPFTDYDVLSRMAGSLLFSGDIASWPSETTRLMRHAVDVYRDVRHLLVEDYYRLLAAPVEVGDWDAGQFVTQDRGEALAFVFRPDGSSEATRKIRFKALPDAVYRIQGRLGAPQASQIMSGLELASQGLEVTLPPRGAVLIHLVKTGTEQGLAAETSNP